MRRWWNGLRVSVRIARRDAVRSRGRTALVAAMIGLPVAVGVGGGVLIASSQPTDATYARWALGDDAQALVISANEGVGIQQNARADLTGSVGSPDDTSSAPAQEAYEGALAAALPTADTLVPVVSGDVRVDTADAHQIVHAVEYPASSLPSLSSAELLRGALPTRVGEAAVADDLARRLDLAVGDTVTATVLQYEGKPVPGAAVTVRVVGVVSSRSPFLGAGLTTVTGSVLPPLPDTLLSSLPGSPKTAALPAIAPAWFVTGPAPVTWRDVQRVNAVGSRIVSREVVEHPGLAPSPNGGGVQSGTVALVAAVAAMALIEAVLLIGPAFAVGARRAERQLALVAASGGDRRSLRRIVLAGGLVVGLGASVVAAALGFAGAVAIRAWTLSRHSVQFPDLRLPWYVLPGALVLGTVVATAAAWVPARRAARVDVAAALAGRRGEARPRRAVPVVGLGLFLLGGLAALYGANRSQTTVLVGGVLVLELGMVAASGGLVSLVARLAPLVGVAGRFALRDAARQRGRTAPAVAAVIAAIAGVAAGAVYAQSLGAHGRATNVESLGSGRVVVSLVNGYDPAVSAPPAAPSQSEVDAAVGVLRHSGMPLGEAYPVTLASPPVDRATLANATDHWLASITADLRPGGECPMTGVEGRAQLRRLSADPRCANRFGGGYQMYWSDPLSQGQVVVDDGTLVAQTDVAGADAAAAALRAGKVVVASPFLLWPDGTAHLEIPTGPGDSAPPRLAAVPAVAVEGHGLWDAGPVLPPAVARELGLEVSLVGALVPLTAEPTPHQVSVAQDTMADQEPGAIWFPIDEHRDDTNLVLLVLVAAALVAGLGSTGIAVALAGAESQPDLATLGAIGASPSVRRRVSAAQAGVIAVLGTALGVLTGIALGYVLVVAQRFTGSSYDPHWQVHLPWLALAAVLVGVPAVTMGCGALFTRSRLPMVRRVVG